jgi:hypothetical protein
MSGWDPNAGRSRVAPRRSAGAGVQVGPLRVTPIRAVVGLAFLGSAAYIGYAILRVRDSTQIPMLSSGFAVLGIAFAAVAIGAVIQMWRAGSRARTRRAMLLALGGGIAGLGAIGCFTVTVLFALLWKT